MYICIDGQPGTGKSTIADRLAERFSFLHVNSGLWYRAVTFYAVQRGIPANETESLLSLLYGIKWRVANVQIRLSDARTESKLFNRSIEYAINDYADNTDLREAINEDIRSRINDANAVIDGRDAGTQIFPDADYKFYFIADQVIRAKRIAQRKGIREYDVGELLQREQAEDNRIEKNHTNDTIFIDTSDLTIDTVSETLSKLIQKGKNVRNKR